MPKYIYSREKGETHSQSVHSCHDKAMCRTMQRPERGDLTSPGGGKGREEYQGRLQEGPTELIPEEATN